MEQVVPKWRLPATVGLAGTGKSTDVPRFLVQNEFAGHETTQSRTTSNDILVGIV